ncbi:unnamed protein product [Ectocarpus sp. 12 AP-2014]
MDDDEGSQTSCTAKEDGDGPQEGQLGLPRSQTRLLLDEDRPITSGSEHGPRQEEQQASADAIRISRSPSLPLMRRRTASVSRRRLHSFVASLVSDVEEYAGRGGYALSPDDREDDGLGCGTIFSDESEVDASEMEAPLLEDTTGGDWSCGGGGDEEEESVGMSTALLTEATPGHNGILRARGRQNHPPGPQEFILRRAHSSSAAHYGGNSVARTVVTYLKGMVGSYVLYLPRMFAQGGMIFSAGAIILLSVASTYNMLLLLRCRERLVRRGIPTVSYGEVALAAVGRVGYVAVDVSLFLSQLGYCVVYLIFVQQNIGPSLREAFPSQPAWLTGTMALMVVQQACIQIPLSWVRQLKYLGAGMLIANICVFGGLLLILFQVVDQLIDTFPPENAGGIVLINTSECLILLGSVVGCFEGIGLVLPIEDAMDLKVRHRLPAALCWTTVGITTFFVIFGAAGYLTYEQEVASFITMDLPQDTMAATIVRVMYSVGLILTSPLQLFPAIKVLERMFWPVAPSGSKKDMPDWTRKWLKNLLRSVVVVFTVLVALVAGSRFDSFTGIVGGLCSVPLALVYPMLFHMSLFGELDSPRKQAMHWVLLVGGVLSGVASTVVAMML